MKEENKKFRAWTDQGTFNNFRMEYDIGILPMTSNNEWMENPNGLLIKPQSRHILQQFTGLLDKNGKEIYEGDIIKRYMSRDRDDFAVLELISGDTFRGVTIVKRDKKGKPIVFFNELWEKEEIEIIGNIYENPELLTR